MRLLFDYRQFIFFIILCAPISYGLTSSFSNNTFNLKWESASSDSYRIMNSTNLITDSFSTSIDSDISSTPPTNQHGLVPERNIGFYRIQKFLHDDFEIIQSWEQETDYARLVDIYVPNGDGPFPVVIHLHGAGGSGNANSFLLNGLEDVIRLAPNGYQNKWNIGKEPTKAPDVDYIRQIINYISFYDNVDTQRITIIGSSNGGGLLHRLMIELEDGLFHQGIALVNNMITNQYDGVNFRYDPSRNMEYNTPIVPSTNRRLLTICGELDTTVPYNGGIGILNNYFFSAQESTYIWARHMGFVGSQIPDHLGVPHSSYDDLIMYSYLDGDVIHYKHQNKGHNAGGGLYVRSIIRDWIGY